MALSLNNLGDLARHQGSLQAAETTYQQAKATAQEIDDKDAIAYVLTGLGDVFTDRGDLATARRSYEESLAMRDRSGEKQTAAETQIALARLAIEEGHAADAAAEMRICKEQFHREHQADDELSASAVLTEALLAQGKNGDAKQQIDATAILAEKSQNRFARFQFALASARVLFVSGQPESSRLQLQQVVKDARGHGFMGVELEARLALAESEEKSGRTTAAQAQLLWLERNARINGFGLIARKAAAERTRQLGTEGKIPPPPKA